MHLEERRQRRQRPVALARKLASCCRSRFVVAGKEEIWCFLIRRPGRVDNTREKREKDARMRERAAKAEPEARRDRRKQTADAECYRM